MPLELEHIPFLTKRREKELDGIYQNKYDRYLIATFKNVHRIGYIKDAEGDRPSYAYDAITVSFNSLKHGKIRQCMVNMDDWEFLLSL